MVGSSTTPTTFLAKDGIVYQSYAEMVEANKTFNEAHLKSLNLDKFKPAKVPRKSTARSSPTKTKVLSNAQVRRSNRVRKAPPENPGLSLVELEIVERSVRRVKKRKKVASENSMPFLSETERDSLKDLPHWIEDMERYLLEEENLSQQNFRSVMRQVERLASGQGITYGRWKEGTYFMKGEKVNLSANFDKLYDEAVSFEDYEGRDLGNGWLLRHPIKKMQNFQYYTFSKKDRVHKK